MLHGRYICASRMARGILPWGAGGLVELDAPDAGVYGLLLFAHASCTGGEEQEDFLVAAVEDYLDVVQYEWGTAAGVLVYPGGHTVYLVE